MWITLTNRCYCISYCFCATSQNTKANAYQSHERTDVDMRLRSRCPNEVDHRSISLPLVQFMFPRVKSGGLCFLLSSSELRKSRNFSCIHVKRDSSTTVARLLKDLWKFFSCFFVRDVTMILTLICTQTRNLRNESLLLLEKVGVLRGSKLRVAWHKSKRNG